MRAVFGIVLIAVGLWLGDLVLSGKFPPASTSTSSGSASSNGLTATYTGGNSSLPFSPSIGGTPIIPSSTGLPTVTALAGNGYQASSGGLIGV
jgi:hypothetical protein